MKTSYAFLLSLITITWLSGCAALENFDAPWKKKQKSAPVVVLPQDRPSSNDAYPVNYEGNPPPAKINVEGIRPAKQGEDFNIYKPAEPTDKHWPVEDPAKRPKEKKKLPPIKEGAPEGNDPGDKSSESRIGYAVA